MTNDCPYEKGKTYFIYTDTRVPIRFTGKTKTRFEVFAGETITYYGFREVITKDNKNWCKGEMFWSCSKKFPPTTD